MRKRLLLGAVLIAAVLLSAGCLDNRTGDVGNKNIRPFYDNNNEKRDSALNGTNFGDESAYRTRFQRSTAQGPQARGQSGAGSFAIREEIAQAIAAFPEVRDAYVAVRGHDAYVAITDERHVLSPYGAGVNNKLRSKIAKTVKSMAPSVRNVYVSAHPEAIERLQWYTFAAKSGQPTDDFLPEFSSITVKRFSDAKIIR